MSNWLIAVGAIASIGCLWVACRGELSRLVRLGGWVGFVLLLALIVLAGGRQTAAQQLLNGIFLGSIYALIALGYTMVYGVLKMINFAHGEVFMVGAYLGCFMLIAYQRQPALAVLMALVVAMAGCAGLGVLIERAAYRPLRQAPRLAALITAIGVSLLLQNIALLAFGASPLTVPGVLPTASIPAIERGTGLSANVPSLVAVVGAVVLMLGLQLVVTRTRLGRAMRAVSEDREAAMMMGIPVDAIITATFIIGSALAGAGGVLYGIRYPSLTPYGGVLPGLKAFVAAVLGGIGSIQGAMIGGLAIGIIEVAVGGMALTREQIGQSLVFCLLLVPTWRWLQRYLHLLPRNLTGRLYQALATLVVLTVFALLSRTAVGWVMPLLPEARLATISGSTFKDAVVFVVLIVILIVKPTGLMGRYAPEKV